MGNLPQFRDIQIPDGVSFFPLAYGWWVLLLTLFLLIIGVRLFIAFWKSRRKYYSLKKLDAISVDNPIQAAMDISELLRRISLVKYRSSCALSGKDWIDFLNQHSTIPLSPQNAEFLSFAPFMSLSDSRYTSEDALELKTFCKNWIGGNL